MKEDVVKVVCDNIIIGLYVSSWLWYCTCFLNSEHRSLLENIDDVVPTNRLGDTYVRPYAFQVLFTQFRVYHGAYEWLY